MANRYSLYQIAAISNRKIFFDANVLIYLFWPSGRFKWERNYSKAFALLLRQNNQLFVDFLVISEIINRSHRIEYEKYIYGRNLTGQQFSYKKYRNSNEGKNALSDIYLVVKESILKNFSIVGTSFEKRDILNFLAVEPLDFVDKAIVKTCTENNFVLCTNDGDYKNSDIDLLSSNPILTGS